MAVMKTDTYVTLIKPDIVLFITFQKITWLHDDVIIIKLRIKYSDWIQLSFACVYLKLLR